MTNSYKPSLAEEMVQAIFEDTGKWRWKDKPSSSPFPETCYTLTNNYSEVVADIRIGGIRMIEFKIIGTIPETDIEINIQGTSDTGRLCSIVKGIEDCIKNEINLGNKIRRVKAIK
jgi:hypothetical protein